MGVMATATTCLSLALTVKSWAHSACLLFHFLIFPNNTVPFAKAYIDLKSLGIDFLVKTGKEHRLQTLSFTEPAKTVLLL